MHKNKKKHIKEERKYEATNMKERQRMHERQKQGI